jgi:REP element-mobilizing transposase RayT
MNGRTARPEQLTFDRLLGGRRKGGGRKKSPDSGVSHLKRERVTARTPVLVTLKLKEELPDLRRPAEYSVIRKALEQACRRPGRSKTGGFRVVDFAILGNHQHLIVEALDNDSLSRGMNGLCARTAKALTKLWKRKGKVFAERYHSRVLKTPREVYNAKRYVYENARKHLLPTTRNRPDPYSSGLWFKGWKDYVHDGWFSWWGPVAEATSWLLREGWKRYGLLELRPAWDKTIV